MRTMRGFRFAAALLGLGWGLTGCGTDGGGSGSRDGGPPPGDGGPDAGGVDGGVGAWVGPGGGVVTSVDGRATLTFPAGAVAEETWVTLDAVAPDGLPPAEGTIPESAYDLGPDGATFLAPVALTIGYAPDQVPADRDEAELRLHVLEDEGLEWVEVPGGTVDLVAHEVTTPIAHFSRHVLAARVFQVPGAGFDRTFLLEIDVDATSCSGPVPTLGPSARVIVGDGTVSFGFGTGEYVAGQGAGSHSMTIPINPVTGCVGTVESTWAIQFLGLRHFTGTLAADMTYTEPCEADPCAFTWLLDGTRPR